jgi:hypothetical protein
LFKETEASEILCFPVFIGQENEEWKYFSTQKTYNQNVKGSNHHILDGCKQKVSLKEKE